MDDSNSLDVIRAYAAVSMGLKELGIIKDPFIEKYRKDGKLLSESCKDGMSIDGLVSLANGEFRDGSIPHQGSTCYVAAYKLTQDGWKKIPYHLKMLVENGIFTKKLADEIMKLPEYQKKVCQ